MIIRSDNDCSLFKTYFDMSGTVIFSKADTKLIIWSHNTFIFLWNSIIVIFKG